MHPSAWAAHRDFPTSRLAPVVRRPAGCLRGACQAGSGRVSDHTGRSGFSSGGGGFFSWPGTPEPGRGCRWSPGAYRIPAAGKCRRSRPTGIGRRRVSSGYCRVAPIILHPGGWGLPMQDTPGWFFIQIAGPTVRGPGSACCDRAGVARLGRFFLPKLRLAGPGSPAVLWVRVMAESAMSNRERLRKFRRNRPDWNREKNAQWRAANREKYLAHKAVEAALRSGKMHKQPCERCGAVDLVHAHHDDYSQRISVMWLCPTHHRARHRELSATEVTADAA